MLLANDAADQADEFEEDAPWLIDAILQNYWTHIVSQLNI